MANLEDILCDNFFDDPKMGLNAMLRADDSLLKEAKTFVRFNDPVMKDILRTLVAMKLGEEGIQQVLKAKTEDDKIIAAALVSKSLSDVIEDMVHYAKTAKDNGADIKQVGSLAVLMAFVKNIYQKNKNLSDEEVAQLLAENWLDENGPKVLTNFGQTLYNTAEESRSKKEPITKAGVEVILKALNGEDVELRPVAKDDFDHLLGLVIKNELPKNKLDRLFSLDSLKKAA